MKKTAFFTIAMVLFSAMSANALQMTISFEDKEQPPYYMGNSSDVLPAKPGVAVEMVKMLEKKINGLKIDLRRTPWKRCTSELGADKVDGIFNASYKKSRLDIGWYPTTDGTHAGPVDSSRRLTMISYSLYAPENTGIKWDGKSLLNVSGKIGAPRGYSIVNDLKKMGVSVDEAPSTQMNLKKILKNRNAAAALQDVTADSLLKTDPATYGSIKKLTPPLVTKPYYLMLSNKFVTNNPEMAQKIWNAIKEIREADFDAIAMKYAGN